MRKVVSLSLDDALHARLLQDARKEGMTLSLYVRQLYMSQQSTGTEADKDQVAILPQALVDVAAAPDASFIASCIITYDRKVLIVRRREVDQLVPTLGWVFPGGRLTELAVTANAQQLLLDRCNITVDVSPVSARVIPDTVSGAPPVVALYFGGEALSQDLRLGVDYIDARWVEPRAVFSYFSTSVSDEVTRYLLSI